MSYLTLPRLHFSGSFQTYPSTINNYPSNYNPKIYPSPTELEKVSLGWGPLGNGIFAFKDCVVTKVEYADGTSATTAAEDPIIGQPVISVRKSNFPLDGTIVDLDPQQQMVSELWALCIQVGGNDAYLKGDFSPAAFTNLWGQCQVDPPPSSTALTANYQSTLHNISSEGLSNGSKFLQYFEQNPAAELSINFAVSAHNNNPQLYDFTPSGFQKLQAAGVPQDVLTAIEPLQKFQQNQGDPNQPKGQLPTKDFVVYILQQFLSVEQYNANIDTILATSIMPYTPYSDFDYTFGQVVGTVGTSAATAPTYMVPSRMLYPPKGVDLAYYTPFSVSSDGLTVTLNLNNSLATSAPGAPFLASKLGKLWLASFPGGNMDVSNAQLLAEIPYTDSGFLKTGGGFFSFTASSSVASTPMGIVSDVGGTKTVLLQENAEGYYIRADQYVFRMNPGIDSTPQMPRGSTAELHVYAFKFGVPVADGTEISLAFIPQSGNHPALGTPESALTFPSSATTSGGKASFALSATDPGNPRKYIDGQLYFLSYAFADPSIGNSYVNNPSDFVSIQVYDEVTEADAVDVLAKFGRLYKIMGFLTDEQKVEQIDMRNMIKLLIEKPFEQVQHMPVSRDMSLSAQNKVTDWINSLNNS